MYEHGVFNLIPPYGHLDPLRYRRVPAKGEKGKGSYLGVSKVWGPILGSFCFFLGGGRGSYTILGPY